MRGYRKCGMCTQKGVFNYKEEQSPVIWSNKDGSRRNFVKWNKPKQKNKLKNKVNNFML
jgi:hypothetical protein